jgi:hypothetical protein
VQKGPAKNLITLKMSSFGGEQRELNKHKKPIPREIILRKKKPPYDWCNNTNPIKLLVLYIITGIQQL